MVVAKSVGFRGEMGLEELDIAGKQKSIVREFLDKEEKEEVVEVEMGGIEGGGCGRGRGGWGRWCWASERGSWELQLV